MVCLFLQISFTCLFSFVHLLVHSCVCVSAGVPMWRSEVTLTCWSSISALFEADLLLAATHTRLAGPQASRDSPDSACLLVVRAPGLWTSSNFKWDPVFQSQIIMLTQRVTHRAGSTAPDSLLKRQMLPRIGVVQRARTVLRPQTPPCLFVL